MLRTTVTDDNLSNGCFVCEVVGPQRGRFNKSSKRYVEEELKLSHRNAKELLESDVQKERRMDFDFMILSRQLAPMINNDKTVTREL